MIKIDKNIYLSNKDNATDIYKLWKLNIKYAIDCTKNNYHIKDPTVKLIKFRCSDPPTDEDMKFILRNVRFLVKIINELAKRGKRVIIFCNRGKNRSSTLAIAYLMYRYRINSYLAFSIIRRLHPSALMFASPNSFNIINGLNGVF